VIQYLRPAALYGLSFINTIVSELEFDPKKAKIEFIKQMNACNMSRIVDFYKAVARQGMLFDTMPPVHGKKSDKWRLSSSSSNVNFFSEISIQYRRGKSMLCYSMPGQDIDWWVGFVFETSLPIVIFFDRPVLLMLSFSINTKQLLVDESLGKLHT